MANGWRVLKFNYPRIDSHAQWRRQHFEAEGHRRAKAFKTVDEQYCGQVGCVNFVHAKQTKICIFFFCPSFLFFSSPPLLSYSFAVPTDGDVKVKVISRVD